MTSKHMKIEKVNDDVLIIYNIFSKCKEDLIKAEIIRLLPKIINDPDIIKNTSYKRCFIDDEYEDRSKSDILRLVEEILFSPDMLNEYSKLESYPFQSIHMTTKHETQLTIYGNCGKYTWHKDNAVFRTLSFIFYFSMNRIKKFKGGDLLLKYYGKDLTIPFENNKLVIFSAHLLHKVTEVIVDTDELIDGRIVVNGHIGFKG